MYSGDTTASSPGIIWVKSSTAASTGYAEWAALDKEILAKLGLSLASIQYDLRLSARQLQECFKQLEKVVKKQLAKADEWVELVKVIQKSRFKHFPPPWDLSATDWLLFLVCLLMTSTRSVAIPHLARPPPASVSFFVVSFPGA